MNIEFLIDHATRELTVAAYVKTILEAESIYSVGFDHQSNYNKVTHYDFLDRTRSTVDLFIVPNYNVKRTVHQLARAIRQKAHMIVQHSEQLFPPTFYEDKFNQSFKKAYNRHIAGHLVWGRDFAEKLQIYADVNPSQIFITGNPKLDLGKRLQNISSVNCSQKNGCGTALVVSNFAMADLEGADWEKFKRNYQAKIERPLNRHYRRVRESCLRWVANAATSFNDIRFLVRPHPGEDIAPYKRVRKFPNVEITGEREFSLDVAQSDVVFQYTSTSIFESLVSRTPVYNLNLGNGREHLKLAYSDLFEWVDETQFVEVLKRVEQGEKLSVDPGRLELLARYMWKPFGNTLLRTAIAVKELAGRLEGQDATYNMMDHLWGALYLTIPFVKDKVLRMGAALEQLGFDNFIYREARRRWLEQVKTGDVLTDNMIEAACGRVNPILQRNEIEVLVSEKYELNQTEKGILISLPDQLEREG